MKKQNKQLTLQQHYDSVPIDAKPQMHHGSGHKGKLAGLNQSMDAGINNYSQSMGNIPPAQHEQLQKMQASGRMETDEQQYHQNYINKSFDVGGPGSGQMKPGHHRGGSHAVGQPQQLHKQTGKKSQGQFASINQYDHHGQLSQAQIAQMNRLQQQNNLIEQQQMVQQNQSYQVQAYGDRQQQQKSKRKHNLSQNMPKSNEYGQNPGGQGMISNNNTQSAGMVQKLQNHPQFGTETNQMSSKRSYENANMEKKANRSSKQKFLAPNIHNSSQVQYNSNPGGNMYETARYNSIGSLHYPQNGAPNGSSLILTQPTNGQSKERFQGTQKIGKKTKISGQGGSIILPAGSSLQNVPQLKPHLSKGGHQTHSNKSGSQLPNHHSQPHFGGPQTHQRMHSLQDSSSVGANMQRGFNSASNAAMQQQAQIVQIYQQPSSMSGHGSSMQKMKYQGNQSNNSRKMIPMLQGGNQGNQQPVSHHKRTSQLQQMSRDRDQHANSLLVDSYSSNNYQTYSQNYDPGHLQEGSVRKQHVNDSNTGRAQRVASREQSSRRALVQGELSNIKVNNSEMNPSKTGLIPQKHKKSQQSSKMGNNQSLQDIGNHHSLNQTTTQGFFDQSTNPSGILNSSGHLNQTSQKAGSSKTSTGGMKHVKTASQYTPQMTQSLKHTISQQNHGQMPGQHMNPEGAMLLQTKKSGPVASQSHVRQNSVQVAVDFRGQDKKISIQHRKNKSVLSNQIRINPQLQNQQNGSGGHQGQKLRVSHDNTAGKQKINQYFDNYTDQAQANFYMQQMNNTKGSNLSLTQQNPHQYQQNTSNLSSASLKHNLTQSTHRKNKTSVIGGQSKMLGINSSTAFPHPSNIPSNLMDNTSNSSMKKIIGGTISHSHKSLRSQSSSRKRVSSIDSSAGPNNMHGQSQKYNLPMGNEGKKMPGGHSGHLTPDLSSYSNGNNGSQIHQMKAQKILKNQTGNQFRQQLKPQGNIVIQQQPSNNSQNSSQHHQNLKSSQGNRRHSSILKGEHQNKQTIFIDQSQNQAARYAHAGPPPNQHNFGAMSPDLEEQASLGSVDVSSVRAINNVFQDGGTGGGTQKPANQKMQKDFKGAGKNSYTDKKASAGKHGRLDSSSEDYNMVPGAGGSAQKLKSNRMRENQELVDIDDADIGVGVPNIQAQVEKPSRKKRQAQGISAGSDVRQKQAYSEGQMRQDQMEFDFSDSINITKEALQMGKICPEAVAQMIADSGHTLDPNDRSLSPRTREMVLISNKIRKSFLAKGDAPKTTPDFYRAGKMLGRGAFGKVSLGMHRLSRKLVALKSINKEFMSDDKQKSKIMHEVGILLRLRHPSVVKLYETFETKRHMLLTMELCAGGDLLNYVRKRKKLDEDVARVIFKQIIEGLGYIHRKRVLHRDIKLDNILLDGKGNVKIADFGVSKLVKPGDIMHEQSGTPAYIAPEILKEEGYMGFKADIWSAGVVFYAMLCGTVPFKASNMKELHKMIIKGKYNLKEEISEDAQNLLRAMLETDPKKRISVQKILNHKWMQIPEGEECEIFNQEERDIVRREFIYNNPKQINRSEKINQDEEPWDCFTELNLDSVDEQLRNESEKSVILAPFNSSISDFDEEEFKGMDASLIIHRLFDDEAPLQDKKATVRFAARCRDQDRQYEINNNGDLDNGVYHKFVYSSRDGGPDPSSSLDDHKGGSVQDLRPQSSRNDSRRSHRAKDLKNEIDRRVREAKRQDTDATSECDYGGETSESMHGIGLPGGGPLLDAARVQTMVNFGYPEEYVRYCLLENEACYCLSAYFLLGEDQIYQ